MATLTLATAPGPADLLVLGLAQTDDGPVVVEAPGVSDEQREAVQSAARAIGATGKVDEVLRLPGEALGLPPLMTTGVGRLPGTPAALSRAAGAAVRTAPVARVAVALPTADPAAVEAVALGALEGAYRIPGRPVADPPAATPEELVLVVADPDADAFRAAADRAGILAEAVLLARRLTDTSPRHLPPAALAAEAVATLDGLPVTVEVLDEAALAEAGYGGILAVGQGSANPPRLVRLAYAPEGATAHLALVGKGITFDSGGLSLKTAKGMEAMKMDMAGAAAVLGAVRALAALGVPTRVTAYLAIAENMPSGSAQRPGDVIAAYGGKTVEVLNTDAEGRLVMMDAIVRSGEDSPDAIVDIATLTGAQLVALGSRIAGVMGNDDGWRDEVAAAADAAGELAWAMPIPEELRPSLDSPVADLANVGERNGGMMTAAAFLREFVPAGVRWAHLDIAGPAYNEGTPWGPYGKGGTGFGVRTLVAIAERMSAA